ncbi:MAG: 2-oxoacid:acceptor oxidoreductase family protein, partial [Oscillospiraceae bacterium]|nr:2-oxoacid:acceptor oxidoreductase family protein [Oscillospiraceae bacterium]
GVEVIEVDAPALAREAGSVKAVNVALLGVLARRLELPAQIWTQALAAVVPAKTLEVNTKAFELGLAQGA